MKGTASDCCALLLFLLTTSSPDFAQGDDSGRQVDIGVGCKMYLECRGVGTPAVVLIAGTGNGAADWHEVLDPADPAHAALTDMVGAGAGNLHASPSAVFPMVSRFSRVCAYDRPGTRIGGMDASTPIAQPHKFEHLLAASLKATHVKGTHSGHNIYLYGPQRIVDAIREMVDVVRNDKASTPR